MSMMTAQQARALSSEYRERNLYNLILQACQKGLTETTASTMSSKEQLLLVNSGYDVEAKNNVFVIKW